MLSAEVHVVQEYDLVCMKDKAWLLGVVSVVAVAAVVAPSAAAGVAAAADVIIRYKATVCVLVLPLERL